MNPYESPSSTPIGNRDSLLGSSRQAGLIFVSILFITASVLGFAGMVVPAIRSATMPRFGWSGLVLCLNPLIFLLPCLRDPSRNLLLSAMWMTFVLSAINAVQLVFRGTVSVVANEFFDRLHSSWLWSVVSLIAIGVYLGLTAMTFPRVSINNAVEESK